MMGDIYRFLSKFIQTERTIYCEIAQNGCCSMTDHPHKMVSTKMRLAACTSASPANVTCLSISQCDSVSDTECLHGTCFDV